MAFSCLLLTPCLRRVCTNLTKPSSGDFERTKKIISRQSSVVNNLAIKAAPINPVDPVINTFGENFIISVNNT